MGRGKLADKLADKRVQTLISFLEVFPYTPPRVIIGVPGYR